MDVTKANIQEGNKILIGKPLSEKKLAQELKKVRARNGDFRQYMVQLFLSDEFLKVSLENAIDFHLFYAHYARLLLVATLLPKAETILDLGGANGSIYEMGYPHAFHEITIVDLPLERRDPMYKALTPKPQKTVSGKISVHFGDMSDLSFASDNSIDLVWSGESIEHIEPESAEHMLSEVYRVLKPGGSFCLDTPNRLVTEIHTKGFIHPEHKIEYYPKQLQGILKKHGFKIIDQKGIREMPRTYETKQFNYQDYILGAPISSNVNASYMQYYHCIKPVPFTIRRTIKKILVRLKLFARI